MEDTAQLVERLRGIQVPDDVSIWPLAPGWWLLRIPDNPAGLPRRKFQREYRRNPPVTARGVPW